MKWHHVMILPALLLGLGAQGVEAQIGAIIDWVTNLSGPGVMRIGGQYIANLGDGERSLELSPAVMYGFKVRDGDGPDGDADLNMWSAQATLGFPFAVPSPNVALLAIGGVAVNGFSGEDFDSFTAFSIPLQLAIRLRAGDTATFRLGGGYSFFRFSDDAFAPLDVGVDLGSWDPSLGFQLSVTFNF